MRYCFKEILEKKGMTCSYTSQKVDYKLSKQNQMKVNFKGSRSYNKLQYQLYDTPVPDNIY